jgi:prefoldin subunit 5
MNTLSEQINNIEGNIENISARLTKIENVKWETENLKLYKKVFIYYIYECLD